MLFYLIEVQLKTVNFKKMELCNEADNKKAVDIYWFKVSLTWWATLPDIEMNTQKK